MSGRGERPAHREVCPAASHLEQVHTGGAHDMFAIGGQGLRPTPWALSQRAPQPQPRRGPTFIGGEGSPEVGRGVWRAGLPGPWGSSPMGVRVLPL